MIIDYLHLSSVVIWFRVIVLLRFACHALLLFVFLLHDSKALSQPRSHVAVHGRADALLRMVNVWIALKKPSSIFTPPYGPGHSFSTLWVQDLTDQTDQNTAGLNIAPVYRGIEDNRDVHMRRHAAIC
jgi:hypothetical protein